MLREIDANDAEQMKNIANEMSLTSIERIKFKVIVKNIPRQKLNVWCYMLLTRIMFNHIICNPYLDCNRSKGEGGYFGNGEKIKSY